MQSFVGDIIDLTRDDFKGDFPMGCGPIDKAGIYRIPIDLYHKGPCVEPSLSSSGIKTILDRTPYYYWSNTLDPQRPIGPEVQHLRFGNLVHTILLENDDLENQYFISSYKSLKSNAAKNEQDEQLKIHGKIWITKQQLEDAQAMVIKAADELVAFFEGCMCELSLIWQDPQTGVWLRCRPDGLPLQPESFKTGDYKTCVSARTLDWIDAQSRWSYHISAWLYPEGIRQVLGREPSGYSFFAQEKDWPYESAVFEFPEEDVYRGGIQARLGINAFAKCLETGVWPSLMDLGPQEVPLSQRKRKQIDDYGFLLEDLQSESVH